MTKPEDGQKHSPAEERNNSASDGHEGWQDPIVAPRGRWIPSLVWLIPLVAALIGISLVVKTVLDNGPTITISFESAEGIEPGKTKVKFKDVDIGDVKNVRLSKDLSRAVATVELTKEADRFAVKDTRFWVVRPRIAANGVSGLNTLLSGAYIGVDAGQSEETWKDFVGLETPPAVTRDQHGRQYLLHSADLGSLDIGSPIYYRRIPVGQVVSYSLDADGKGVAFRVFVSSPYDKFVGANTRFWHASGVDVRLDASGFKLNTQSLAAVVTGGIAFQAPSDLPIGAPAPDNTSFRLASDESDAMRDIDKDPVTLVLNFNQSLRGLQLGSTVDFRGITLGRVTRIGIVYDRQRHEFTMPVTVDIYPERLGKRFAESLRHAQQGENDQLLATMVARGLRAQLRTGNFLTGQLYIALDFFPQAAPVKFDPRHQPVELPTIPNTLDQLQLQVADIATKLQKVPFDKIGNNLNDALQSANGLFKQLDSQAAVLGPQAQLTLEEARKTFGSAQRTLAEDSPLQGDVRQAMQELTRTAQSLSVLADYLERHPEALIHGKSEEKP